MSATAPRLAILFTFFLAPLVTWSQATPIDTGLPPELSPAASRPAAEAAPEPIAEPGSIPLAAEPLPERPQPQPDAPRGEGEHTVYPAGRGVISTVELGGYTPITGKERVGWVLKSTFGVSSLAFTTMVAGIQTARNEPPSYGTHWDGFGKRFGQRIANVATDNVLEAGIGSLWGEDPRYFRQPEETFGGRVKHAIVMAFADRHRDGSLGPAYARYIAYPSSNFLSDTWRVPTDNGINNALSRTAFDFLGKIAGNSFKEFWPDVARMVFHRQ